MQVGGCKDILAICESKIMILIESLDVECVDHLVACG